MSTHPHPHSGDRNEDRQDAVATGRAGHNGVLFAMCLSLVLVVASVSALNLALPDLAIDLSASNSTLTWIADGYTVALAALVLPLGAIGAASDAATSSSPAPSSSASPRWPRPSPTPPPRSSSGGPSWAWEPR
ncbi:hypothetical protein ABT389_26905 [Streptomyces bacillaris]|uniref:hypothetical protein n=1 Tax=Streptomyces bacillaris TaxID=68179 RepID=UPI003349B1E5